MVRGLACILACVPIALSSAQPSLPKTIAPPSLPRTETGKLQRFKLRQGAGASPSHSPTKATT